MRTVYNNRVRLWSAILVASIILISFSSFATAAGPNPPPDGGGPSSGGLINPLGDSGTTIPVVLTNVVNWLLGLAGILALLALVWGGIRYITALGNESTAAEAKKIITWAIIGLLVVGGSYAIINTVVNSILKAS